MLLNCAFLFFCVVSVCCSVDILSKFSQNDYKVKDVRFSVTDVDENYYNFFKVVTFKWNRTVAVSNISVNYKVDVQDNVESLVQGYKFASNEYRTFPIHFQANLVEAFDANVFGMQNVMKCGNMTSMCFRKGVTYHVCNFIVEESKFPPLMPSGQYRMDFTFLYFDKGIATLNLYFEVYRPIFPPKRKT